MAELKKDWVLSPQAFCSLLHWLDEGAESDGVQYLTVRRRLIAYFDRKNCLAPDDLADETLNRVARKLEEKGEISGVVPLQYCYITAKFVFLENLRQNKVIQNGAIDFMNAIPTKAQPLLAESGHLVAEDKMSNCLEKCLNKLSPSDRELILEYYQGEQRAKIERRSRLASRLGLTMNALSIRACRIRNKLEACVKACSGEERNVF